ncbi:uncharacterized protein [Centruroides vittatus]|uniref:uncharacterized protein n=1 Tax=Centruroides vittatus TaxID=120091 RepID=UPI003510C755
MSRNDIANGKKGSITDIQESKNLEDDDNEKISRSQDLILDDKIHGIDSDSKIGKFYEAIRRNNVEQVRRFLEEGINANEQDIATGKLPLIEATNLGHVEIVKALLTAYADVNRTNIQGSTALHVSVSPKAFNKEIVELFLERRSADYNIQDTASASTPLHILIY